MSLAKPFYPHDSDSGILLKKDRREVGNWTADLEYIREEVRYLLDIAANMPHNRALFQQLQNIRDQNKESLLDLQRYENTLINHAECDTLECDVFYLKNHELCRKMFREHLEKYRVLKSEVLRSLLRNANDQL